MYRLIHFIGGLVSLSIVVQCQIYPTQAQQFYKVCNGDLGPHVLLCSPRTGVVIRTTDILFTLQQNPNKECETVSYYNVSEAPQNLQNYCNRARDRSICEIPREYSVNIFTRRYQIPDAYYPVPLRYQIRFDCLESAFYSSALKLSSTGNIINLVLVLGLSRYLIGF